MMKSSMTYPSHTGMTIKYARFLPEKPGQVLTYENQIINR